MCSIRGGRNETQEQYEPTSSEEPCDVLRRGKI